MDSEERPIGFIHRTNPECMFKICFSEETATAMFRNQTNSIIYRDIMEREIVFIDAVIDTVALGGREVHDNSYSARLLGTAPMSKQRKLAQGVLTKLETTLYRA